MKRSILTEKVARRGHHIVREYGVDPFETLRVASIMATPAESLMADQSVEEVVRFFTDLGRARLHKSYPVVERDGRVIGIVSRADIMRWIREDGIATGLTLRPEPRKGEAAKKSASEPGG